MSTTTIEAPPASTKSKAKPLNLKRLLQAELLAVCGEATKQEREKREAEAKKVESGPKPKFTQAQIDTALKHLTDGGLSGAYGRGILAALSVFFDAPELIVKQQEKTSTLPKFPLFCVVVVGANKSSHDFKLNTPFIVVHSINNRLLIEDRISSSAFNYSHYNDQVRVATDKEVKQCIKDLTDAQIRVIMSDPAFGPIMNAVVEAPLSEASKDDVDDE